MPPRSAAPRPGCRKSAPADLFRRPAPRRPDLARGSPSPRRGSWSPDPKSTLFFENAVPPGRMPASLPKMPLTQAPMPPTSRRGSSTPATPMSRPPRTFPDHEVVLVQAGARLRGVKAAERPRAHRRAITLAYPCHGPAFAARPARVNASTTTKQAPGYRTLGLDSMLAVGACSLASPSMRFVQLVVVKAKLWLPPCPHREVATHGSSSVGTCIRCRSRSTDG